MSLLVAENLGVQYLFDRQHRTASPTIAWLRRTADSTWALRDLTFRIEGAQAVALLGSSGSGKSTLLRVLANVLTPDEGTVEVRGRVGPLLSVQAGVMASLTGRENVDLIGVLAGLSSKAARSRVEEVKEISGLGDAFERLVGGYSQGMRARLGLAIIEVSEPRILLLDEIHEALDDEHREHIAARAARLVKDGGIVVAAGHDHPMLRTLCSRAMWLRSGELVLDGAFDDVCGAYLDVRRS